MATNRVSVRIVSNRIPQVVAQIEANAKAAVDETAADIQQRAEATAPRDTGSLAASIYRTNGEESDYGQRSGRASNLNDGAKILPEIRLDSVISTSGGTQPTYGAVVAPAVSHGLFQELGTRFQRAQPFLLPATLGNESDFVTRMSKVAD